MSTDLSNRRVLAVTSNYGVEQDELVVPVGRLRQQGAEVTIAGSAISPVQTLVSDRHLGQEVTPDVEISTVDSSDYDLLLVPGGTINADNLRLNEEAVKLTNSFSGAGRPIAAICHGPWLLVEAGIVNGRTLTSYPSLRTDIGNAGGSWDDKSVIVDSDKQPVIITSRNPGDIDDFSAAIAAVLAP